MCDTVDCALVAQRSGMQVAGSPSSGEACAATATASGQCRYASQELSESMCTAAAAVGHFTGEIIYYRMPCAVYATNLTHWNGQSTLGKLA